MSDQERHGEAGTGNGEKSLLVDNIGRRYSQGWSEKEKAW